MDLENDEMNMVDDLKSGMLPDADSYRASRRLCVSLLPEIHKALEDGISYNDIALSLSSKRIRVTALDIEYAITYGDRFSFLNGSIYPGFNIAFGNSDLASVIEDAITHSPLLGQSLYRSQLMMNKFIGNSKLLFNDFISNIKLANQWAKDTGYEEIRLSCDNHNDEYYNQKNLPGSMFPAYQDMLADYRGGATIACAEDVTVCLRSYKAPRLVSGKPDRDQVFFIFSKNGDYLYKNNYLSSDTDSLRFFKNNPFRGNVSVGNNTIVDWGRPPDYDKTIDGEFVFIGGRSNFTHFIFDHLANIFFIDKITNLSKKTLVFFKLNGWQKELLNILGIDNNYLEIEEPEEYGYIRFRKLWIPTNLPMLFRVKYIQERIQSRYNKNVGERRVFISRSQFDKYNRISNEEEIKSILQNRGFDIVHPELMSISEKMELFSQAGLVMGCAGSSETNFSAFGHPNTILISLYPEFFFRDARHKDRSVMYTLAYHIPTLERVIFVKGKQDERLINEIYQRSEHQVIDCPAYYDPLEVEKAINEAEARLAKL